MTDQQSIAIIVTLSVLVVVLAISFFTACVVNRAQGKQIQRLGRRLGFFRNEHF